MGRPGRTLRTTVAFDALSLVLDEGSQQLRIGGCSEVVPVSHIGTNGLAHAQHRGGSHAFVNAVFFARVESSVSQDVLQRLDLFALVVVLESDHVIPHVVSVLTDAPRARIVVSAGASPVRAVPYRQVHMRFVTALAVVVLRIETRASVIDLVVEDDVTKIRVGIRAQVIYELLQIKATITKNILTAVDPRGVLVVVRPCVLVRLIALFPRGRTGIFSLDFRLQDLQALRLTRHTIPPGK